MPPAPIDMNEWWLAAAAATATAFTPAASTHAATPPGSQVGVATTVQPSVTSVTNERTVFIGNAVTFGERFQTDSKGVLHILFMDQSSMTLGPNSELVIDEFTYNPETRRGSIAVNFLKGAMRVVGGFISKFNNPQGRESVQIRTATATVGIRGGITMVESNGQNATATFLFGQGMSATDTNGNTQTVTRAGFGTSFGGNQPPTPPQRIPVNQLNSQLNRLENRPSNNPNNQQPGGAPPGQLLSTGDRPGGSNDPGGNLSSDRLNNARQNDPDMNGRLRNVLDSHSPTPAS
jgi:hypothetical protein